MPETESSASRQSAKEEPGTPVSAQPSTLPHGLFRTDRGDDDCLPPISQYSSDDDSSHEDWEADHSMPGFDLNAEIKTKFAKGAASPAASTSSGQREEDHDDYFPEDERSSSDWESDHSTADFDLNAEIEAKLGKAPPPLPMEAAAPAPSSSLPDPPSVDEPRADAPEPHQQYFPEDERSSMDWEDDHSMAASDPDAEVADRLKKNGASVFGSASPAPAPAQAAGSTPQDGYYPEDERSSMDWEDDHSSANFDLNAEIDAKLGKAADAERPPASADGDSYMHPGLAASLSASLAYAQHGLASDDAPADKAAESGETGGQDGKNERAPEAQNRSHCPASTAAAEQGGSLSSEPGMSGAAGDAETSPLDQEKSRPFDDAGSTPASDSRNPGKSALDGPPPPPGTGAPEAASGGDDEEEEDEEEEDAEEDGPDQPMTLRDHLNELRKRVFRAFLWALVGFIGCYPFAEEIFKFLFAPLTKALPGAGRLIYTSPPEAFFTYMKVAFVAGIFATSPLVFYQVWAFIAPGLYKEEKTYIVPVAIFSALFFICGGAFCYYVAFPFAFEFFMSYSTDVIVAMPALSETLSFVLQLLLAFGLIFELPLFVFFLARLGIVTADLMRKMRRYAILANVIVAAILTPPDVMSQMLMAGPLLLLYEISIIIAAVFGKKKPEPAKDEEEEEDDEDDDDTKAPLPAKEAKQDTAAQ